MKKYEKVITACLECPAKRAINRCELVIVHIYQPDHTVNRHIPDIYEIPDWCPLEDVQ